MSIHCQQAVALRLYITPLSSFSAMGASCGGRGMAGRAGRSEIFNEPTLISLLFFSYFSMGGGGVVMCANAACLLQFGVLLSCGFITRPLLTVLGLRQQIPCHRQPTRWIKTKANPGCCSHFLLS